MIGVAMLGEHCWRTCLGISNRNDALHGVQLERPCRSCAQRLVSQHRATDFDRNRTERFEVNVAGVCLVCRVERTARQTLGIYVDAQGVRVRASAHVPVSEIERVLDLKAQWILKHWQRVRGQVESHGMTVGSFVPDLLVAEGGVLRLCGHDLRVRWFSGRLATELLVPESMLAQRHLWVRTPRIVTHMSTEAETMARRSAVLQAVGAYFLAYARQRAQVFCTAHDLHYRELALSSARTTWGTCRRDGLIRLNWRLAFLDVDVVDYVIAHELAHTVHMHHQKSFWDLVAQLCPNYLVVRSRLKTYSLRDA